MVSFNTWRSLVDGESISAIPDSAVHQLKLDDVNGSVLDSIGDLDGTTRGVTSIDGDYVGGSASEGDGVDDDISLGTWGDFDVSFCEEPATILFTVDGFGGGRAAIFGNSTSRRVKIETNDIGPDGSLDFLVRPEGGGDEDRTHTTNGGLIDDGNKHRIALRIPGDDVNNWEFAVDGNIEDMTVSKNEGISDDLPLNQSDDVLLHRAADDSEYFGGVIDNFIVTNSSLSDSKIVDDYNQQPWS